MNQTLYACEMHVDLKKLECKNGEREEGIAEKLKNFVI